MQHILIIIAAFVVNIATVADNNIDESYDTTSPLIVNVEDIDAGKGDVFVGVFDSEKTFRQIEQVYKYEIIEAQSNKARVTINVLPHKDYAVVIFQDVIPNKKFDTNFIGVPREPFGFSTNYVVKNRAPSYKQVAFIHGELGSELTIKLQKFGK